MDELAFRLVFVALDALGAVSLRIERNGVNRGGGAREEQRQQRNEDKDMNTKSVAAVVYDRLAEPDAMGEHFQTASEGCMCTKVAVSQETGCESQRARN